MSVYIDGAVDENFLKELEERTVDSYVEKTNAALSQDICSKKILSGEVVTSENEEEQVRSFSISPLCIGEEIFGAISIASKKANAFAKGEIHSFHLIASQATIVIDDAARYEALEESRRKIDGLHHIASKLGSSRHHEEVYQLTVEGAEKILGFHICSIGIVEEHGLEVKATCSGKFSQENMVQKALETDIGKNELALMTCRERKTFIHRNLTADSGFGPAWETFRSGLSASIGKKGVFQTLSPEPNAYSTEDIRLLELLLGHAAEALQRIDSQLLLREQAIRDPLTGVYNRRYLTEFLENEVARSKRYNHPIGFLIIDVDKFKIINDTYGHQTGDRVLKAVAAFLLQEVRQVDTVVRYGGDEFLIVMPEITATETIVKDRIEKALLRWNENNELFGFPVSLSIGCTRWDPDSSETVEQSLKNADQKMYWDKRHRAQVKRSDKKSVLSGQHSG
jgi:diguanylate cyclase (GGDEF)-like protein